MILNGWLIGIYESFFIGIGWNIDMFGLISVVIVYDFWLDL